jgi:hypothetical protein
MGRNPSSGKTPGQASPRPSQACAGGHHSNGPNGAGRPHAGRGCMQPYVGDPTARVRFIRDNGRTALLLCGA